MCIERLLALGLSLASHFKTGRKADDGIEWPKVHTLPYPTPTLTRTRTGTLKLNPNEPITAKHFNQQYCL